MDARLESRNRLCMPSVLSESRVMWVYEPEPDTSSSPLAPLPHRTRVLSVRWVPGVRYASVPMMGFTPCRVAFFQKSNAPNILPWSVIAMAVIPCARVAEISSATRAAQSSIEYSVCTCRCANDSDTNLLTRCTASVCGEDFQFTFARLRTVAQHRQCIGWSSGGCQGHHTHPHPLPRPGKAQRELARVQPLPRHAQTLCEHRISTVHEVTDTGMALCRHVHPNLVGSSCLKMNFQQGCPDKCLHRLVVRDRVSAVGCDRKPPLRMGVSPDGRIDRATQGIRMPLDNGVIDLCHLAVVKLSLQLCVGSFALCHNHEPTRAGIKAVHNPLPLCRTRCGNPEARRSKPTHHRWSRPSERGMRRDSRRFVHDHDVFVIVDDIHAGNDNGFNTQHSWCLPRHGQPRIRMQSI